MCNKRPPNRPIRIDVVDDEGNAESIGMPRGEMSKSFGMPQLVQARALLNAKFDIKISKECDLAVREVKLEEAQKPAP